MLSSRVYDYLLLVSWMEIGPTYLARARREPDFDHDGPGKHTARGAFGLSKAAILDAMAQSERTDGDVTATIFKACRAFSLDTRLDWGHSVLCAFYGLVCGLGKPGLTLDMVYRAHNRGPYSDPDEHAGKLPAPILRRLTQYKRPLWVAKLRS